MANNNQIYKMSNAGGFKSLTRYYDMLAGNTVWNPWEPQGAYDALATVTLTATTASITFAGIPTGYKHLQIRGIGKTTRVSYGAGTMVQFNGDTAANYANHELFGDGAAAYAAAGTGVSSIRVDAANATTSVTNVFGVAVIDILDYASTSKNKTLRALAGTDVNGAGGTITFNSGVWLNTSAITSITLFPEVGSFMQYSSYALYGVR